MKPITVDETLTIAGRPITADSLAQARQQLAAGSPWNAGWYEWANCSPEEQRVARLDAAGWLRALARLLPDEGSEVLAAWKVLADRGLVRLEWRGLEPVGVVAEGKLLQLLARDTVEP